MALGLHRKKNEDRGDGKLIDDYLLSGKLDSLGILYGRYIDLVYGVCLKYFRNREQSQDAVMDIFEKLVTELGRHKVENFKSWLYVLTKNHCLMKLRSSKKDIDRVISIEDHGYLFMENDFQMHPVDKSDINNDEILEKCIEQLKADQRNCVRLFYYDNKCYREIAGLLKMDEQKVKSHLQNAKRNLKICMEKNYEEE
ncbi:MAG: sigma-70 family RNA polymerase sigma factor [Bacteroidales bacterium]|nr:sigma-70 family RNA polymerase sigma factor [Bacteroidales bacterium]